MLATSLRQHKPVPEIPIATWDEPQGSHRNLRKTTRFPPQREMRPFPRAVSREKLHIPSWNVKGYLTPLMQLRKVPETPIPTREEPRVSRHNSRRALFPPPQLEMRVNSPASSGKEFRRCHRPSGGGRFPLETWVHPQESCLNSKRPRFPQPFQISLIPLHWLN